LAGGSYRAGVQGFLRCHGQVDAWVSLGICSQRPNESGLWPEPAQKGAGSGLKGAKSLEKGGLPARALSATARTGDFP